MAPMDRLGTHYFWNALKKSSEWKWLAGLALVLMTMPLAEVDNERIFSLKRGTIATDATRARLNCRTVTPKKMFTQIRTVITQ
jgi:hypothetical protein